MQDVDAADFAAWLHLREPADAAARAPELVEALREHLAARARPAVTVVHDLGSGTGSMARWLAPQLDGPQHWILVDRDAGLLDRAVATSRTRSADGARVTVEKCQQDLGRLAPQHLQGAALVTASALLDMLHDEELDQFVAVCATARCPVLVALSVTGRVELDPADPRDERVRAAFNDHQRRQVDGRRLLGPDAVGAAAAAFRLRGCEVLVGESPWHLGPARRDLAEQWFAGWLGAACEQDPALAAGLGDYGPRRTAQAQKGRLTVTVHHQDLLVLPR